MPASIEGWHLLVPLTFSLTLASGYWAAVVHAAAQGEEPAAAAASAPGAAELLVQEDEALPLPGVAGSTY